MAFEALGTVFALRGGITAIGQVTGFQNNSDYANKIITC